MSRTGMLALAAVLAAGCTKTVGPTGSLVRSAAADEEMASSLQVRVSGNSVRMDLYVTNSTSADMPLEYPTAQRYDFEVQTPSGERLWRWSDGRMFAQVAGTEALGAGQTLQHGAAWDGGSRRGRYVAVARLTAANRSVERRAFFDVP